jgi:hypothetical protein
MKFIRENWKMLLLLGLAALCIYEIYKAIKAGENAISSILKLPKKIAGWLNPFIWFSSDSGNVTANITPGIDPLTNQPYSSGDGFAFGYNPATWQGVAGMTF